MDRIEPKASRDAGFTSSMMRLTVVPLVGGNEVKISLDLGSTEFRICP